MSQPAQLHRINSVKIQPVPVMMPTDNRPIKGQDLFPDVNGLYANIFCVASKNSGKSTVIARIVQCCATKETQIIAFVSTLYKDNTWLFIQDWCKKNKIPFEGHLSIMDGKTNLLQELVDRLQDESEEQKEAALSGKVVKHRSRVTLMEKTSVDNDSIWNAPKLPRPKHTGPVLLFDDDNDDAGSASENEGEEFKAHLPLPKNKEKCRAPEYIIILDDLSTELRNPALPALLKKNRHFRCKIIVSSQYIDMFPDARSQIDYWLLWGRIVPKKLEVIYDCVGLPMPLDTFMKVYETVTDQPYQFLYIDVKNGTLRRNFDYEFVMH